MTRKNPSIPWCSNCGAMMPVLAKPKKGFVLPPIEETWFECFECDNPDKISYEEGQERVKNQKEKLRINVKI